MHPSEGSIVRFTRIATGVFFNPSAFYAIWYAFIALLCYAYPRMRIRCDTTSVTESVVPSDGCISIGYFIVYCDTYLAGKSY